MHQSTTPSLSQTIWPRWASRHFLTLPIVETLLPVTFGYSLSSETVVMRQLRRWKRLRLPRGLPEVVGTVQQVHCRRRKWLRRGIEFHVCTINTRAHTINVWKLIKWPSYVFSCKILWKRKCTWNSLSHTIRGLNGVNATGEIWNSVLF